jgi:predicted small secreted protein
MSIEIAALTVLLTGVAALVIVVSAVLAQCENEARGMVKDGHRVHFGS